MISKFTHAVRKKTSKIKWYCSKIEMCREDFFEEEMLVERLLKNAKEMRINAA